MLLSNVVKQKVSIRVELTSNFLVFIACLRRVFFQEEIFERCFSFSFYNATKSKFIKLLIVT